MSLNQIVRKLANNAVKKGGNNVAVVTERRTQTIITKVFHVETYTKASVAPQVTQAVSKVLPNKHVTDSVKLASLALNQNQHSVSLKALERGIVHSKNHVDALHVARAAASVMENVGGFREPAVSAVKRAIDLSATTADAVVVAQFAFNHQNVGGFVSLSQDALRRGLSLAKTTGETTRIAKAASTASSSHGGFGSIVQDAIRRAAELLG